MENESRIIEAFKLNQINKILLIDDAYDSPDINNSNVNSILNYLESHDGHEACISIGIDENKIESAIKAAQEGDLENNELNEIYCTLYDKYIRTEDGKFDPGTHFMTLKGASLAALKPLCALLRKCGNKMEVRTVGLNADMKKNLQFRPQVLFLDYYLERDIQVGRLGEARKASLELLKKFVSPEIGEDIPAIVLMSSKNIEDVEEYRHDVGGDQILSLRFGFLKKEFVQQNNSGFEIKHETANVLLDMSQGYLFGRMLQQALNEWKKGTKLAFNTFMKEVADLHTKDFAYLLRFRLREEGQPLSEYLEWLFGECLKGLIGEKVDWNHSSFLELDSEKELEEKIEGAFEGPSVQIAKFFHRVRINNRKSCTSKGYRLGDIYGQLEEKQIRTVVTPDCDLIVRRGKTKVNSVLTMGGMLKQFDTEDSIADEFFILENQPYCMKWNPKDLQTYPAEGEESLQQIDNLQFLGTLRPLYAQGIQRRALSDLSRIGFPVAPALGINATVTAWIRTKNDKKPFEPIDINASDLATIIPSRGGQRSGHRVLLRRGFFNELIDYLYCLQKSKPVNIDADAKCLYSILRKGGIDDFRKEFLQKGALTKGKGKFGTGLVLDSSPNIKQNAPWLQITVTVKDEVKEELLTIDPLDS